jgi:hypothetical protein
MCLAKSVQFIPEALSEMQREGRYTLPQYFMLLGCCVLPVQFSASRSKKLAIICSYIFSISKAFEIKAESLSKIYII